MHHTLEKYQSFPIIAWATIIAFCLLVYSLVIRLDSATLEIENTTNQLEAALKAEATSFNFE